MVAAHRICIFLICLSIAPARLPRSPWGDEDTSIIRELLERVQPDQIYVAGDLADPHGTHRVCAEAIFFVLSQMQREGKPIPEVMLYRGAWQEYALHEIEIAIPLSPSDIELKRQAIFMHESQKDEAALPGLRPSRILAAGRGSQ